MTLDVRGRVVRALSVVVLGAVVATTHPESTGAQAPAMRWDGAIEHVSIANGVGWGQPSGDALLSRHPMSRDGRFIVFAADVPNPPYPTTHQMFRRDRLTGQTELLTGAQVVSPPVVSADGSHVAFQTCDTWLRPDGASICDVYLVDFRHPLIVNMSTALDGTLSTAASDQPMLSGDGRFLVFRTTSPTLLPPGAAPGQIVLRDRDPDANGIYDEAGHVNVDLVSVSSTGEPGDAASESAEVSADGRFVAFRSLAGNLVPGDTNNTWDVFLRDRLTGQTRRINVGWNGQQATSTLQSPAISMSASGDLIAFASDDPVLADPPTHLVDTNNSLDVLVYDQGTGLLTRINVGANGNQGNGHTCWPTFSEDGRYLSVLSTSTNVAAPVSPGRAHAYVYDRFTDQTTRISVKPDGTEPNQDSSAPVISGDGSYVLVLSKATNLVATATAGHDALFGFAHFDVSPMSLTIPGTGGVGTVTITAQRYVTWQGSIDYDWLNQWLNWETLPRGSGDGSVSVRADLNTTPGPRTKPVVINSKTIEVTQQAGLSLNAVTPAAGPNTGGTPVTLTGTGFEPGMQVVFDGIPVAVEIVSSTTMHAVTPPHAPGAVYVYMRTPDFRYAVLNDAFRYLDTTPPLVTPSVSGTLSASGWYTSNVTVDWYVRDPDSALTQFCSQTVVTSDTAGTTITCTATSGGGTTSVSVTVRRDATGPELLLLAPTATIYDPSPARTALVQCWDPLSAIATCVATAASDQPIDMAPGYHLFELTATDFAGNRSHAEVTYAVASGACEPRPAGLAAWWPFESGAPGSAQANYTDVVSGVDAVGVNTGAQFGPGIVGDFAMSTTNVPSYVNAGTRPALEMSGALTLSGWVFPTVNHPASPEVIAGREGEYLLARFPDGTLRWSIANTSPGWGWVNTGRVIPWYTWTHVTLTYDGSSIATYVNGQLVYNYNYNVSGPIGDVAPALDEFRIGARQDPASPSYFTGGIDDLQVLNRALSASEVQRTFFAGSKGLCGARALTLSLSPGSVPVTYNTPQEVEIVARLTDGGSPVAGRFVTVTRAGQTIGSGTTDANGEVHATASVTATFVGTSASEFQADHAGDFYVSGAHASAALVSGKAAPQISWVQPEAVAYGTALGPAQLNASATTPGTFTYDPPAGTVPSAGVQTLTVTFEPAAPALYTTASATATLTIGNAAASVIATGGTFTYDGAPHAATASATGVGGAALTPVIITYNGAAAVPVNAGTYAVLASFAGDANYDAASGTATLTIGKAAASVTATGGTFTYDGASHAATASATGVGGAPLTPVIITYNGAAAVPVSAGTYAVLASFAGDANYDAASATATLTIGKAAASVTATGGTFTYDGASHAATVSATGVGGAALTPVIITYNGAAAVPVSAGTYAVLASFAGDANYAAASGTATLTIGKAAAVLGWSDQPAIVYGTPLGAAQLNAVANTPGTFSYAPAAGAVLGAGSARPLSATFSPADSTNYVGGSIGTTINVGRAPLTIRANDSAKPFGAPLPVFTASGSGFVNGESFASLAGTLAFSTSASASSPVGAYAIVPSGVGSPNYVVTFANGSVSVVPGTVTVAVGTNPEPSGLNQPMTFTASLAVVAPAAGTPTGAVRFFDGSTLLGTAALTAGVATLRTAGLDAGTRAIQAIYDGDGAFAAGSGSSSHVVRPASGTPVLTVTSSRNPATTGQSVTLTANVSMTSGAVTGSVQFYSGSGLLGTGTIASGVATFTTTTLPAGSQAITALYAGNASAPPSRSPVFVQAVGPSTWKNKTTTMALSLSPNPSALGQAVAVTASVTGSGGTFPTGRILIMIDGIVTGDPAGQAVSPASGSTARATLSLSGLAHGRHGVTVTYLGDSTYKGSTAAATQQVN